MDPLEAMIRHLVQNTYDKVVAIEETRKDLKISRLDSSNGYKAPGPTVSRSLARVLCLHCACANEEDFNFCKKCGVRNRVFPDPPLLCPPRVLGTTEMVDIDEDALEARKAAFRQAIKDTKYDKETNSVMKKFEIFVSCRWDNARRGLRFMMPCLVM